MIEVLERLERADRELAEQWRFASVSLDAPAGNCALRFSAEEEAALEEQFGDALAGLQAALAAAQEAAAEISDPVEAAETARSLKFFGDQAKRHVVNVRKLLVAYSQRAKRERLEQARAGLMSKRDKSEAGSSTTAQGSALDVTAALKRTRQVMTQEIERMSSATKVLDEGRSSLRSSHEEFGGVQTELAEWQARQDKMWIAAGVAVLAATVLFIVHERTGFLLV